MGKAISQLTDTLAATSITNAENIWIGVDNSGDGTSYKLKLSELQKVSQTFSVKSYGAKGDGTTDDTAAIQAAIDAAQAALVNVTTASTGSTINREIVPTVYFPSGKYVTNSDLTVTDYSACLKGDNAVLIAGGSFSGSYGLTVSGVTFLDISGLTFVDYPNGIQAGASPNNVPLGHIRISDSAIVGNEAGTGLYLYNRSSTASIENVQFDNWVHAVDCESVDHVTFDRCRFRLDFFEAEVDRPNHDGHILLKTGHIHITNCVFNPNLSTYAGTKPYAWVYVDDPSSVTASHSVWCNLTITDTLFGGEGGGLTPVIWDAAPSDANPSYPRTCQLIRCNIGNSKTAVGTGTWAAALVPLQLPNIVHIHDCMFNRIKIVPISYRDGVTAPTPWESTADKPFYYSVQGNAAGSAYAFGRDPNWIPADINNSARIQFGACVVMHADGTRAVYSPTLDTRAGRGEALEAALAALVTQTAVDLPGSTLYLYPGADYEATDLTVTSKDGIRIIGQNNVIWNTPSTAYNHILRFTTCDDVLLQGVAVQGDGALSNPANPASVTNTGTGVGIYFHTCARPRVINCESHGTTGAAAAPYPYNGSAHGLWFVTCSDVYVDGFVSNYAGCYGLATTGNSTRINLSNCHIYNARARSMQLTPGAANPYIHVSDCTLMSDETVNTLSTDTDWFSYIPMIDVGNTGALVDTVTLSNVNFYWLNPSASATASGSGFPLLKIQDVTNCRMNNCTLWHGNAFSAGTGSPYTLSVITQNSSGPLYIEMNNCYLSMDFTTTSYLGSYQPNHLRATGCHFNADIASSLTFYNFHGTMIVRDCTFSNFNNGVFDLNRDSSGYLEVVGCTFNGTGTTNNVFYAGGSGWNANAIGAWAGDYLVCNNIYNNCRVAAAAADRMVLNTATGDRNEIVWDDSLAGDHVHPAPGTSPGVFASVSGQAGMKIKNKNYSPNATSTWAAEYAWWSTSTGSWQDS